MNAKKIAIVSFSNNYDMQEYMYSLHEEYKNLQKDVYTFGSSNLKVNIKKNNNNYFYNVPSKPGIEFKTFNLIELLKIANKLKKFDVIYFISSHTWNILLIILLKTKVKILHSIHDPFPHENEKMTNHILKYNRFLTKTTNNIVLHNYILKEKFKEFYNFKGNVIVFPLWRKWLIYNESKNNKKVLFFGRVNPYKGVEAIEYFARELTDIEFSIVGKFSREMMRLKEKLQQIDNIKIYDEYVNEKEMDKYFYENDIVILPYNSATQSGVIIEAYRHSKAVIAFNVGAIREQILDHKTGFVVERNNLAKFKQEINEFFTLDEKSRNQYSKSAYELGENIFTPRNAVKTLNDFLSTDVK